MLDMDRTEIEAVVLESSISSTGRNSSVWGKSLSNGFMMHQTTSQCCKCCCFQPNIDWTVHEYNANVDINVVKDNQLSPVIFSVKEDADYWGRCISYCYPGYRPTTYSVQSVGDDTEMRTIIRHQKTRTCPISALIGWGDNGHPLRIPCCCYLPYLDTFDAVTNEKLGSTKVLCDCAPLCCPKYAVFDAYDKPVYLLQPDLCCYDQCYQCPKCEDKAKCCFIPFYIRDFETKEKCGDEDVAIVDLYIGMKHELCTKQNLYAVKFPASATDANKATLMGATLLYDITLNEQVNA